MLDFLTDVAVQRILGVLLRQGLAAWGGTLIEQGLVTKADWDEMALRAAPVLVAGVLSIYQKVQQHKREQAAIALPPSATSQDVTAAVKAGVGQ